MPVSPDPLLEYEGVAPRDYPDPSTPQPRSSSLPISPLFVICTAYCTWAHVSSGIAYYYSFKSTALMSPLVKTMAVVGLRGGVVVLSQQSCPL